MSTTQRRAPQGDGRGPERVKTGQATVAAIYVHCPYCEEPLADQSGSQMLAIDSVAAMKWAPGQRVVCSNCGQEYRLPAILGRL